RVRMSLTTACGRISSSRGSRARAASAAWAPSGESGSGGGNIRYSSAAAKPSPAPSTACRRSSQVSIVTSWPRAASAHPSEIAGNTCPGSPKAATRKRPSGGVEALTRASEHDLWDVAVLRGAEQEAHRLAEVLGPDHLLRRDLPLDELGHRRLDEARRQRRALDPGAAHLAVRRLGEVDHRRLGGGVDREPSLSALAGDRSGVDDQRLAVLFARLVQQRQPLAGADYQRPQVDAELHVEVLGLDLLHRRSDADAGVVDEHVEAAVGLSVPGEDADEVLLLGHVRRSALDLVAGVAQLGRCPLELLRSTGGDRERVALLAEDPRDRKSDAARCPRYQCRSLRQLVLPRKDSRRRDPICGPPAVLRGGRYRSMPRNIMPRVRSPRVLAVLCCPLAAAALALSGCGDSGSSADSS